MSADTAELRADPIELLRRRTSAKWTAFPPEVVPMFVAEMDYPLFPPVAEAMIARIRASDTGYVGPAHPVADRFAGFARRRWGWNVDPDAVRLATDVSVGIVETLRLALRPGDGVVITPPVYPPFFDLVPEAGGRVVEVPLRLGSSAADGPGAWSLDLDGIRSAFADGRARAVLLCSPHNPLGLVHSVEQLAALAEIAAEYDALVLSDEIHAPLTHPEARFTPFLAVSDAAREQGIALHSASKAFNLAGVKASLIVAASDRRRALLDRLPEEVHYRTSLLGAAATAVAFEHGDDWLEAVVAALVENRMLLRDRMHERLPLAVVHEPRASFVAWVDLGAYRLGADPSELLVERARVAFGSGPAFGAQGGGHIRVNYACSPELLSEAIERTAAALN